MILIGTSHPFFLQNHCLILKRLLQVVGIMHVTCFYSWLPHFVVVIFKPGLSVT